MGVVDAPTSSPADAIATSSADEVHPNSISRLQFFVSEQEVRLEWQIQMRTIMEVPQIQWDGEDLWTATEDEARRHWPAIQAYLHQGFEIRIDGEPWEVQFVDYELRLEGAGFYVDCVLPVTAKPEAIHLEVQHFFEDGNEQHIMDVGVHGLTKRIDRYFIQWARRVIDFPLPLTPEELAEEEELAKGPLRRYFKLGWEHVLEGTDHLAFVLALLFGVAAWGSLLAAVTAFTVAHSITLALASFEILTLPPWIVEPSIALSVMLVLWWHIWKGPGESKAWKPAFGFGLLHGCGFAGVLGEIGIPEEAAVASLLGFNLGVEAGQLTFVVPVIAVGLILGKVLPDAARKSALQLFSLALAAFACHLVGGAATNYIGIEFPLLPDELQSLPSMLIASIALAVGLRFIEKGFQVKTTMPATHLGKQIMSAFVLGALYEVGLWLGG